MTFKYPFWFLLCLLVFPFNESLALPPPDLIISGLQSVVQVFGVLAAFLVSAFFLLKDTLKIWWQGHRKIMIGLICGFIIFGLIALVSYLGQLSIA